IESKSVMGPASSKGLERNMFFSPLQCLARCQLFGSLSGLLESLLRASLLCCCWLLSGAVYCVLNLRSSLARLFPPAVTQAQREHAGSGLANRRLRVPGVQGCLRRECH